MSKVGKKVIIKKPLSQDGLFIHAGAKGTIVREDESTMPLKIRFFEESLNDTVVNEEGERDTLSNHNTNGGWWLDVHHIRIGSLCYLNNRPVNL